MLPEMRKHYKIIKTKLEESSFLLVFQYWTLKCSHSSHSLYSSKSKSRTCREWMKEGLHAAGMSITPCKAVCRRGGSPGGGVVVATHPSAAETTAPPRQRGTTCNMTHRLLEKIQNTVKTTWIEINYPITNYFSEEESNFFTRRIISW